MRAQSVGELLPGATHAELPPAKLGAGRLIIVGDVHGCLTELRELLAKIDYREGNDTVVLVGDLVEKGPHSLEVGRSLSLIPWGAPWRGALEICRALGSEVCCYYINRTQHLKVRRQHKGYSSCE
jgi:hypothetical protein